MFEDVKNPTMENSSKWCQPFPSDIAAFPAISNVAFNFVMTDSKSSNDSSRFRDPHIPSHLPSYPPVHTYNSHHRSISAVPRKRSAAQSSSTVEIDSDRRIARKLVHANANIGTISAQKSLIIIEDSVDTAAIASHSVSSAAITTDPN